MLRERLAAFAAENKVASVEKCLHEYSNIIRDMSKEPNDVILSDRFLLGKRVKDPFAYNFCLLIASVRECDRDLTDDLLDVANAKESLFPEDRVSITDACIVRVIEKSVNPISWNWGMDGLREKAKMDNPDDKLRIAIMKKGLEGE